MNIVSIVLIHSPLVGPLTWAPVSRSLRRQGLHTMVPHLDVAEGEATPVWVQCAREVASSVGLLSGEQKAVYVSHSGSGPLLPAIGAWSPIPVAGYVFVDAGLPHPGRSWMDQFQLDLPDLAGELLQQLEAGGRWPEWTDDDLQEIIPDVGLRKGILTELQPRSLTYFSEVMPNFADFPDAPCAYLEFTYHGPAQQAQQQNWPHREIEGSHFHMLVDPDAVAASLIELFEEMRIIEQAR